MAYRNANYCAFYVDEPFSESNLRAYATRDFLYYNQLRAWKAQDPSFPFIDAHAKTYSVRDGSDWESTLKPRLHERLRNSKNIILVLSSITRNSRALREEMNYGMGSLGLPVIVVYPEYREKDDIIDGSGNFKRPIRNLWDRLPAFRDYMEDVAVLHIPYRKDLIESALMNKRFMVSTMDEPGSYFYRL